MAVHEILDFGEIGSNPTSPTTLITKCKICGKECKNIKSLKIHLNSHNIIGYFNWYNYLCKYENFEIPKCPYCGKNCKLKSRSGYQKTCGNKECIHKFNIQIQKEKYELHPELRDLHRKLRNDFLKNKSNRNKTAWMNKANGKYSYLEKIFIDEYIIPNNLQNKYEIINEYSEYPYFLDFAFIDIKVDVEIDGKCHFSNGINRINHDIIRDKELINKGWKIYRISYNEINDEKIKENFLNFINSYKEYKYDVNRQIIKYKEYKTENQILENNKKKNIKIKNNSKIHDLLIKIGKENDLSKFGWCKIVQNKLKNNNIEIKSNIRRYIKTYCPEFFKLYKVYNKKFNIDL